jgi:hypothetical protein
MHDVAENHKNEYTSTIAYADSLIRLSKGFNFLCS